MKPSIKKVRWGIIGCGNVTEVKSGPAFQKANKSELVAVMRRDGNLAKDYAERHHVEKWFDDASALINDPDVDAIYIATPPSSHKKFTLDSAQAGKPVYVEKPMALNYTECLDMIEACEQAEVPLFVALYRRALPRFLKVKQLLNDGKIGEIRTVNICLYKPPSARDMSKESNWRLDSSIAGCGYFCDLAPHMIDLLIYFLGPIESVSGITTNLGGLYKAEDTVSSIFEFKNGVHGVAQWSFVASEHLDRTEIIGSKGKIIYSNFGHEPIVLKKDGAVKEFFIDHPLHIQQPLIQSIVDELTGQGRCPSTGKTAVLTQKVMDEILGNL
jgi:predicted dehydrogenase